MNQLLNPDYSKIEGDKSLYTAKEIASQPTTWLKVWEKIERETGPICSFLKNIQNKSNLNIVFTGAGSSAFIGDTVAATWLNKLCRNSQAIPTTDLVTHFKERIVTNRPLLLISFARSGNSPESTAAVMLADAFCDTVYHLIITCNPEGKLAKMEHRDNTCVFLLPEKAEDQSLAMTNSFTSMALAATIIPRLLSRHYNTIENQETILVNYGKTLLENFTNTLQKVSQTEFNRIVFLGSGPLLGIARESHLKVQELTNGKVVGKFDSFLGFRHGPKAILNDQTLLVYLLSNDKQTYRYEKDLVDQVAQHDIELTTLGIAETDCMPPTIDYRIHLADYPKLEEDFWAILCTLPAQLIGFYKSILLGYNPDHPSNNGTISRVVKGVTIYDNLSSKSSSGDNQ